MSRVSDLYALQETDRRLDAHRSAYADVEARLGESDELLAARQRLDQAQQRRAGLLARQQELEWALDDLQSKIGPRQKKLYDGSIRSPKELTSLQEEVEMLLRQKTRVEDDLLQVMAQVEEAEQLLADARADLAQVEEAWRREQEALQQERERLLREIKAMDEERRRRATAVPPSDLALYEQLRQRRQGQAVAKVELGLCQGCRISLPTTLLHKVRSSQTLVQCSSCERILYGG